MKVHFVGCGDAFGSGGRFNTCFHVTGEVANFLIDCGATSLVALKRAKVALNDIRVIFVTHFHADHFAGVASLILEAQLISKRDAPLTVAGPHGLRKAFQQTTEALYHGSSAIDRRFDLELMELKERQTVNIDGIEVTPFLVTHGKPGGPFFAYRIEVENRVIAYSGDTEWTDALIDAGGRADLLIAETYMRDKRVKLHLDLATLETHLPKIAPKRLILTHMSDDMLGQEVSHECAEDGMVVEI